MRRLLKWLKKGFTLVELVIVIAVIAILASVLIPTFGGIIDKANQSAAQQNAANIYREVYALDLADGELDGKEGTTAISVTGATFDETNKKWTVQVKKGNATVNYDGKDFS